MMTKSDTIEAIVRLNPSASPDFLATFSVEDLVRYLDRLTGGARAVHCGADASPHRAARASLDHVGALAVSVADG